MKLSQQNQIKKELTKINIDNKNIKSVSKRINNKLLRKFNLEKGWSKIGNKSEAISRLKNK